MGQKIIHLYPNAAHQQNAKTTACSATGEEILVDEDTYVAQLRQVSDDLRTIAKNFNVTMQEVVANFLYIAVGDEIVNTMLADDPEEDG